jgi:tetratricopeptide (TPR) repeat protein
MQTNPANRTQLSPETLLLMEIRRADTLKSQGHYQEALEIYWQVTAAHPEMADVWSVAANTCIWLKRWQDAIGYAQTALARGGNGFLICDVLGYAHRKLGLWSEAARYVQWIEQGAARVELRASGAAS